MCRLLLRTISQYSCILRKLPSLFVGLRLLVIVRLQSIGLHTIAVLAITRSYWGLLSLGILKVLGFEGNPRCSKKISADSTCVSKIQASENNPRYYQEKKNNRVIRVVCCKISEHRQNSNILHKNQRTPTTMFPGHQRQSKDDQDIHMTYPIWPRPYHNLLYCLTDG